MPKVVGFLAGLSLASAAFAATRPVCQCGPPTPESYKWNFSKEAFGLLAQFHQDAYGVLESADTLEEYNREPFLIDWRADSVTLDSIRDQVNRMDQILCRLRTIERVLPPEQQAEINKITPATLELTDTAQAAIHFLDRNEDRLFLPSYAAYAREMYSEAARIERSTTSAEKATASTKLNQSGASRNPMPASGS
jgi:hypothetical protein